MNKPHKNLNLWKSAMDLVLKVYEGTKRFPGSEAYGLINQIRRAAVSIPSNIAEGDERGTNKESVRFLYIAKGSLAELQTQLEIAHAVGYIDELTLNAFNEKTKTIGKMLGSLIKSRSANGK